MPAFEVIFSRDTVQYGRLLIDAESSDDARIAAQRLPQTQIERDIEWHDYTAGAAMVVGVADEPVK